MDASFEEALRDPGASVATQLHPGSRSMLVAFGGIAGALGIPPFEFFNLTRELAVHRVYVRDLSQSWYHRGLPGVAADIAGVAEFLRDRVRRGGAERTVLVGNSMGGYAALLFGALLDADEVHAFSPQTFIDPANRATVGDDRWQPQIDQVYRTPGAGEYFDLVPVLRAHAGRCAFHLHFSPEDLLDAVHATRLHGVPGVTLHLYEVGGHAMIKHLRQTGELERIVEGALGSG